MKSRIAKFVFSCLLAAMALNAAAQALYRWVDENGRVQYSDMPPPANVKNAQQKKLGDNLIQQDDMSFSMKAAIAKNPVTLYATNCGAACDDARALLNKRGIPFAERNPEKDPDAAEALQALIGVLEVPAIAVGSSDKYKGFTAAGWNRILNNAGYPSSNVVARPPAAPPAPAQPPAAQ